MIYQAWLLAKEKYDLKMRDVNKHFGFIDQAIREFVDQRRDGQIDLQTGMEFDRLNLDLMQIKYDLMTELSREEYDRKLKAAGL